MTINAKIEEYAPVAITVLNRYNHFKRCLESLERCNGAEYTDVYVGLDYPPLERYVEGWKEIDGYLKKKEACHGFKNLYVRRRNHNCGAGRNVELLYNEIKKKTDRYVFTEDDNEFSPCFLDYMNKALEKYKDDDNVICICGYTPFDYQGNKNVYFARQMFAWGVGRWGKKVEQTRKFRDLAYQERVLSKFRTAMRLYRFQPIVLKRVMDQVVLHKLWGDVSYTCYCVQNSKYCLFPSKTLVRNRGNDGTGMHCKVNDTYLNVSREICQDNNYELDNIEVFEPLEISNLVQKAASRKWYDPIVIMLRYLIWRATTIDIFSLRKMYRKRR